MKKYLGSKITAFAAVVAPLFLCCPLLCGVFVLCTEISGATVFLFCGGLACSFVWGLYIKNTKNQLYSWGYFMCDAVRIKTLFSPNISMVYEKCKGCGIGFYTHGVLNSGAGSKVYFIYLSYDILDEYYRTNINLWKPSQTRIKVQFSKKLYDYLCAIMPRKQSQMLIQDYMKYFG